MSDVWGGCHWMDWAPSSILERWNAKTTQRSFATLASEMKRKCVVEANQRASVSLLSQIPVRVQLNFLAKLSLCCVSFAITTRRRRGLTRNFTLPQFEILWSITFFVNESAVSAVYVHFCVHWRNQEMESFSHMHEIICPDEKRERALHNSWCLACN